MQIIDGARSDLVSTAKYASRCDDDHRADGAQATQPASPPGLAFSMPPEEEEEERSACQHRLGTTSGKLTELRLVLLQVENCDRMQYDPITGEWIGAKNAFFCAILY